MNMENTHTGTVHLGVHYSHHKSIHARCHFDWGFYYGNSPEEPTNPINYRVTDKDVTCRQCLRIMARKENGE